MMKKSWKIIEKSSTNHEKIKEKIMEKSWKNSSKNHVKISRENHGITF